MAFERIKEEIKIIDLLMSRKNQPLAPRDIARRVLRNWEFETRRSIFLKDLCVIGTLEAVSNKTGDIIDPLAFKGSMPNGIKYRLKRWE